ncbi:MAG: hypothetical protein QNI90_06030 [Dinoroseobacter sp.]|nr:hypothetical protein [Dinoroseobacter sp.]
MRQVLRRVKASQITFRKSAPPVVVMALRRGGSTMLADAIAGNRGVWFADEPYAMFRDRPGMPMKAEALFTPEHSHFFDLSGIELEKFTSFSNRLLNAEFYEMGTSRKTLPGLRADRVCLKVLNAPWMLDWFLEKTDANVLALVRHPGAQALSVISIGWQFPVEAYLNRQGFMEEHFTDRQVDVARRIFRSQNKLEIGVLDWIVTSHPLRSASNARLHTLRYEDIVRDPDAFVDTVLVRDLGLGAVETMKASFRRPSGSSRMSTDTTNAAISKGDVEFLLQRWRAKISDDDAKGAQALLDTFEVDEYRFV